MEKVLFSSFSNVFSQFQPCECMHKHAFAGWNTQQAWLQFLEWNASIHVLWWGETDTQHKLCKFHFQLSARGYNASQRTALLYRTARPRSCQQLAPFLSWTTADSLLDGRRHYNSPWICYICNRDSTLQSIFRIWLEHTVFNTKKYFFIVSLVDN